MDKPFRTISEQVRLLEARGVTTDEATPAILLREGYYAVVNGYGKAFLDEDATARAGDDRYRAGTRFADIHHLFRFDRELRALTFRAIMSVEGTLRSVLSHTFCEHHRSSEAYYNRHCYTTAKHYLRGPKQYEGDLEWMISTFRHHAEGHAADERQQGERDGTNARIAWYRKRYDAIPLWVLCSDLTFGNLRYFFALMREQEQRAVCARMAEVCGTTADGLPIEPASMLRDMETLSELRNDCAHVERIYDARFGEEARPYPQMVDVLAAFLAADDEAWLRASVTELVSRFAGTSEAVATVLAAAGF